MKCFILPQPPDPQGLVRLTGKDYHYLARVRRFTPGSSFHARLPGGKEVMVRVKALEGACLLGECLFNQSSAGDTLPPLVLFQALPKGAKMDLIIRQAAEGGIAEIVPFAADYSIPKTGAPGEKEKTERWERIIKEARQQSGSGITTAVRPPCTKDALFVYWEALKSRYSGALGLLLHQEALEQGTLHGYLSPVPEFIALAIGPEGGFSPGEVSRFLAAGFKPLILGNTVLRTETAALYGAAAVRVILLESASWTANNPQ
ncbi:MAG: 16S rRNA (uracil(1498)-N(3))-methyltransferase [Treponema sp.]|jgi:16S rRNA (uracil1498-N3)-methyltransferase|nr:16S rRNA (uracil(1498)-N(3))-methyltransferase [Treponema sp.]